MLTPFCFRVWIKVELTEVLERHEDHRVIFLKVPDKIQLSNRLLSFSFTVLNKDR